MDGREVHIQLGDTQPLKVGDEVFKSAFDWNLSEEDLKKAVDELGETEEEKETCLRKLKEKLSNDSNIKYRQDDFYLLRFLRSRKYDDNKAYQNMKLFMESRKKNAHLLTIPVDTKSAQEQSILTVLPYMDEEKRILFSLNLSKWKAEEKTFDEVAPAILNVLDIASMNPNCQINGVIAIYNLDGLTFRHITELLRSGRLWLIINTIQNGYPWRIKKWYILSTNRIVRFFYSLIKPLMTGKLAGRGILMGSNVNELHQYVNPALLPKSLNGTLEEVECDTSQLVLNNLEYLRYERSFG